MSTRILRIEDTKGIGLYGVGNYKKSLAFRLGMDMGCYPHRPSPEEDGLWGLNDKRDHYAFRTTDQLINWLDDIDPEDVYDKDGVIVELQVTAMERGRNQVRYHEDKVVARTVLTLDQFYDKLYV